MTIIVSYAIKQKGQGHILKYISKRVIKHACDINQIATVQGYFGSSVCIMQISNYTSRGIKCLNNGFKDKNVS